MNLTDKINGDIKAAMLAKEREKLAALRAVKSALLLEATKDGSGEVNEDVANKILQKLYKQRKDAAQLYVEQGRQDLADDEIFQAGVIEEYLPKQMTEEEIMAEVKEAIKSLGASSPADMGKVMGVLTKKLAGKADGKVISKLVREGLQG